MPKISIEQLLQMSKLLSERIKNGTIGDLLNLIRQVEIYPTFDVDKNINNICSGEDIDLRMVSLYDFILRQIGYLMLQKSPKVDHREYDMMKELMNDVGFQVFKIDDKGKEVGVELDVGDYEQRLQGSNDGIEGTKKVVVERKSDDFLPSVFTGHLDEQLSNIVNDKNIVCGFLIIDKSYNDLLSMAREREISENIVHGTIGSLCWKGFIPLFADNRENFSKIVDVIFQKAYDGKDRIYRPKIEIGKGDSIISFPNVDEVIGTRLLQYFGNIKNIINATEEELQQVKGVGKKVSRHIFEMVNHNVKND